MTKAKLSKEVTALRSKLEEFKSEVEALRDTAQEYADDRSEKWQESEAGEAYQALIENLDSAVDGLGDVDLSLAEVEV